VATDVQVPQPPFFGARIVESVDVDAFAPFVNKVALFRGQWGFKKGRQDDAQYRRQIDEQVEPIFQKLL
jgi:5-methyltetrahydrofolate--homocysteine methyltransferase